MESFERPKRLLPGPPWAKIVVLLGSIFLVIGAPMTLVALYQLGRGADRDVLLVFFIVGPIFALVGGGLLFFGLREVMRWRALLARGVPVWGIASNVGYDTTTEINGRNPIVVYYTYADMTGQARQGSMSSLDEKRLRALQLDRLQVLYDPDHPDRSLLLDLV